jgi:DNA repair protein RadC
MRGLFDLNEREQSVVLEAREILSRFLSAQPVLTSWDAVIDYLHVNLACETKEQFRVLFLDTQNRLICDWVAGSGTVDHVPVYPREVIAKALEVNATAIVLAHNHPSGMDMPSQADKDMTKTICDVADLMGIKVHDHIIVTAGKDFSFRANGLL